MAGVALVVHGVSNRNEEAFNESVRDLQARGGSAMPELVPVFWGALGPEGPLLSIPGESDTARVPAPSGAVAAPPSPEALAAASETAAATVAALQAQAGTVPPGTVAAIEEGTRAAAAAGWTLALSADVAPLLAQAVLAAPPAGGAELAPSGAFGLPNPVKAALDHVQAALVSVLVRVARDKEAGLGPTIAHTLGDVLNYGTNGAAVRGTIDTAYRATVARADHVDLVAHSLGALACVEWLLGATVTCADSGMQPVEGRKVRHLVTFGAQVSLFSELEGLRGVADKVRSQVHPQALPIRAERWSNVWQELDPLAFVVGHAFGIEADGVAGTVEDLRLTQLGLPTDVSFHSSYWRDDRFARWLAGLLAGG